MKTTNEKKIIVDVVNRDAPHLVAVLDDVIDIVRVTFSEIGQEVHNGNKVLVKNFGTFALKERKRRRRFDSGLKQVVETEPKDIMEFIQSLNIFRKGDDDVQ